MNKSDDIGELAKSLVKFQSEVKDAERTKSSYNGKYADLEGIYSIIRPLLSKNGICFKQDLVSESSNEIRIKTWLIHTSGQYMASELTVSVPAGQGKTNSLQQVGVAASYARRYAIMGAVGITQRDEDDDADSLSGQSESKFPQAQQKPKPQVERAPEKPKWVFTDELKSKLEELILLANYTNERVCERFNIKSLSELTEENYNKTVRVCNRAIDEKVK